MGLLKFFKKQIQKYQYAKIAAPEEHQRGSAEWLIAAEKHFGGFVKNVPRRTFSEHDPRPKEKLLSGGMQGGDRMFHHGYARLYADHLAPFLDADPLTIMEVGILKGTGIAVWSKLFPQATIYALDLDTNNFLENYEFLASRGAFAERKPLTFNFDQFQDGEAKMAEILQGVRPNIFIDDGHHSNETIMRTAEALKPHLHDEFVCFFEDNDTVAPDLAELFSEHEVLSEGRLTVISSRMAKRA